MDLTQPVTQDWLIRHGAEFVKDTRERYGYTQAALAEELGVTTRTISSLENDSAILSKTTYLALMYIRFECATSVYRVHS